MSYRNLFLSIAGAILALFYLPVFAEDGKSLSIKLEKDNLLSIIEPLRIRTGEADKAHKRYYDVAIDLAQQYGYRNHGVLRVTETIKGEDKPRIFALASWPNAEADATFESLPMWQEYKALRPVIWETLRFFKSLATKDTELVFTQDKIYTVAFFWFAENQRQKVINMQNTVEEAFSKVGGSHMFQMFNPRFDTHSAPYAGPDLVTVTEWQSSSNYKNFDALLNLTIERKEIYRVVPIIR